MSGNIAERREESGDVTVSVSQGEAVGERKLNVLGRLLVTLCQCVIEEDYRETLNNEDSFDTGDFLPPQSPFHSGRNTLVLDLDETLIHSALQPQEHTNFIMTLECEGVVNEVYVAVRPDVRRFLEVVGELFEVVLFTASTSTYANPILDLLDQNHRISHRLFRPCCIFQPQGFLKDLSRLGRDLQHVLIIDVKVTQNSPQSYALQPENALPISSWFNDQTDRELLGLIPVLEELAKEKDVRKGLQRIRKGNSQEVDWSEATVRARGRESSPVHQTSRHFPLPPCEEDTESILQPAKRCQTDSGLSP